MKAGKKALLLICLEGLKFDRLYQKLSGLSDRILLIQQRTKAETAVPGTAASALNVKARQYQQSAKQYLVKIYTEIYQ